MTDNKQSRRDFVAGAAKGGMTLAGTGLAFGAGFTSFAEFARAETTPAEDHFMIFVELRGGIQWMTATDGRNVDALPLTDPNFCVPLKITDAAFSPEDYAKIVKEGPMRKGVLNGKFLLLPYFDDLSSSFKKGRTTLGADFILGFAGQALLPHADDLAVVRGIHMVGDFHGLNNASGEIFCGSNSGDMPHVSGVVATMLQQKHGAKLLDNLVFENATYVTGGSNVAKIPVKLDAESLGYIVANAEEMSAETAAQRFAKARELADALARVPTLGEVHRKVFQSYVGAMTQAPKVREMLLGLKSELAAVDASLDLDVQFKTALTLIQAGLTRVVTLCLGSPNGKNKVDGFGLFDAHRGVYHLDASFAGTANTQRHHLNVTKAMAAIGAFIDKLKATKYGDSGKTMFDVTTVVVGTEFSRPSNFFGNEAPGSAGGGTAFGCGHYQFNNNYILFGKGVRGGAWVGKNEDLRQMGAKVDFTTVETQDPNAIKYTPVEYTFTPSGVDGTEANGNGSYAPKDLNYQGDNDRPFMAKDVVKTVMAAAGVEARFLEAYSDDKMKNAKAIRPMVKA